MNVRDLKKGSKVHIMGVCGTAMASLACELKNLGFKVTGSDTDVYPPMSLRLADAGIDIMQGFKRENLSHNPDLVVVGNVMTKNYEESRALLSSNIAYTSFASLVGESFMSETKNIVIAGTHGKTSIASLMSWVLDSSNKNVDFFIGGVCNNFSKQLKTSIGAEYFVIEGDEYDSAFFDKIPKFMHYKPNHLILTSIEFDHQDIYPNIDAVKSAFLSLLKIQKDGLIVAYADKNVLGVLEKANTKAITYGFENADYVIEDICIKNKGVQFSINHNNSKETIELKMFGRHNILNATAVYILSKKLRLSSQSIKKAFLSFKGVKRRAEVVGVKNKITIIDDFAHHPTAVKHAIDAFQQQCKGKVISVFEPRSFTSRGSVFQKEYFKAFSDSQFCIICDVIAKPSDTSLLDTELLVNDIKNSGVVSAFRAKDVEAAISIILQNANPNDIVLIMSNGGFGNIYQKLLNRL